VDSFFSKSEECECIECNELAYGLVACLGHDLYRHTRVQAIASLLPFRDVRRCNSLSKQLAKKRKKKEKSNVPAKSGHICE
jgi:hypothetical protein